jgi:hypothetical protein
MFFWAMFVIAISPTSVTKQAYIRQTVLILSAAVLELWSLQPPLNQAIVDPRQLADKLHKR